VTGTLVETSADARARNAAPRVRGLSPADAIAVVFIAAIVAVFLEPHWPVGVVLIGAVAGVYAAFRTTRGLPMRRRALAMTALFIGALSLAMLLEAGGS
jgi:hypothetical protein